MTLGIRQVTLGTDKPVAPVPPQPCTAQTPAPAVPWVHPKPSALGEAPAASQAWLEPAPAPCGIAGAPGCASPAWSRECPREAAGAAVLSLCSRAGPGRCSRRSLRQAASTNLILNGRDFSFQLILAGQDSIPHPFPPSSRLSTPVHPVPAPQGRCHTRGMLRCSPPS